MTVTLSPLQRITSLVPDADAATNYLLALFGADPIAAPVTTLTAVPTTRIAHIALGDAVLEFVEPSLNVSDPLRQRMQDVGPTVTSLTYAVADMVAALAALADEDVHPIAAEAPRVVLDMTALIGFDIELIEQRDAKAPGVRSGRVSPMIHVEVTHFDIEAAAAVMFRLFAAPVVEQRFFAFLNEITAGRMLIKHVLLGDTVIQLIQPRHDAGPWYTQLKRRGPSVHNITWLPEDMPAVGAASEAAKTQDLRYFEFDYGRLFGHENLDSPLIVGRIIDCAHILGFHLELSERQARNAGDYILKADWPN